MPCSLGICTIDRDTASFSSLYDAGGVPRHHQNAPSWVWFVGEQGTPEELPKTASGKVQKHILREWSKDLAGKGVGAVR